MSVVPSCTRRFDAFGSYGFLAVRRADALPDALALTRQVVADVDATCSRFRDDSDLSRANRRPGRWVDVDPLLVAAVSVAVRGGRATDGLVGPCSGGRWCSWATTVTCTSCASSRRPPTPPAGRSTYPTSTRGARSGSTRAVGSGCPTGTALDLGSTGKALAADLVANAVERELDVPAVVSLGGDVRVAAPDGRPWPVDRLGASRCGARHDWSGSTAAAWRRRPRRYAAGHADGVTRHHLLDPRTGLPAPEVWRTVTATGPTCVAANTASTAAVVLGPRPPPGSRPTGRRPAGRRPTGGRHYLGGWPADPTREAS